jgi:3-oxoacyl-[acyl-carrier-protein] synthase-3
VRTCRNASCPNEALTQFPAGTLPLIAEKTGISRAATRPTTRARPIWGAKRRASASSARLAPEEIDVIILATSSPDRIQPARRRVVQELIGARKAYAFDVGSVCSARSSRCTWRMR